MTLANPGWLILLLLLPVIATGAALTSRLRTRQWSAFVAGRLRPKLLKRSSPLPRWIAFACLLLAAALLIIALARPQTSRGTSTQTVLGRNILLAIDLSRSMKVADIKPDRLTQAKAVAFELLDELPDDRIGLVGFAGTAYLFAPLTVDHAAIRETLAQLDIDWIPSGGSNLAAGLELAIETLKATGTRQNALILLTDGEENSGRIADAATTARDAGIEVITIGFGTTTGDFVPDPAMSDGRFRDRQGREVVSRLEPDALQRLSSVTGGRFAIATSGADIPAMVQTAVADLERVEVAGRQRTVVIDHYQWFVLPAILLLIASAIAATRWRGVGASAATALVFLTPAPLKADPVDDARAAMAEERFEDAKERFKVLAEAHPDTEEGFRFRLAQGNAAYESQDWATARSAFSEALRSADSIVRDAAHHGMGNTLFQIGWMRLSEGPAYPETTELETEASDDPFDRISDALLGRDKPADPAAPGEEPLADFERMVKARMAAWMQEESPPGDRSPGAAIFHELLTDWIDSVKHHESVIALPDAKHNRSLTVTHLKKLREILNQLDENAQQLQAVPQAGQGQPQPQQGEEGEGEGEPGEQGEGGEKEPEGPGGEEPDRQGENGDEQENKQPGAGEAGEKEKSPQPKPGESPEEAARRILNENADLQKGALSPGRVRFRRPDKDW